MRLKSDFDIPYGHKEKVLTLEISGMSTSKPVIQKEACTECGTCYLYCPTGAVSYDDNGIYVVSKFCKGCGICVKECPTKAISMMEISGE